MIELYSYWRSSAAYRVRIGLHLKGLPFEYRPVDLARDGGAKQAYRALNSQGLVPTLVEDGVAMRQSLAILEYLDERYPEPRLLPRDPVQRARAREIALIIAADLHPLNNLRVLRYLERELSASDAERRSWYHRWLESGLEAAERLVEAKGLFALGETPGLADLFIVPQLYNARRYEFPLSRYPRLRRIDAACSTLDAFARALPERQPDAPAAGA